jgi:hypothetical protein
VWELEDWIEQGNVPLVALREPLDCIASWSVYRTEGKFYEAYTEKNLEYDVNFYIRLMSSVLNHKDNILFFDFNKFIEDLTYVKNAIVNLTNENPVEEPTAQEVHNYMKNHPNFYLNVPRETKTIIEANKPLIQKIHNFVDAQEIYNQLMQVEAMQFKE